MLTRRTLLGGAALGLAGCGVTAAYSDFAGIRRAQRLDVVPYPSADADLAITLLTLQGVLAQSRPRLYANGGNANDAAWLAELERAGIATHPVSDAMTAIKDYIPNTRGVVLYASGDANSVSAATTLAGVLGGVAVTPALQAMLPGHPVLADARGHDATWAQKTYGSHLRRDLLIEQAPTKPALRDYAVATKSLAFWTGNDSDRQRILAWADPLAAVLGWGDASHGENVFVGADSAAGCFNVASDYSFNLSALSAVQLPASDLRQKPGTASGSGQGKHTVTFVMTDGDNVQWQMGTFCTSGQWFGSPQRGTVPMGWTTSPALGGLAPSVTAWLYGKAKSGKDVFLAGPSGLGYCYPSQMPNRPAFAQATAEAMAACDLRLLAVIDENGLRAEVLGDFLRQRQIDGITYWEYSRYDTNPGQIQWIEGKTVVCPRHLLWTPQFKGPEALAIALNAQPTDPTSPEGYSLVAVHAWSQGFAGVLATVPWLAPSVEVVPPDVFFARIRQHGVGKAA